MNYYNENDPFVAQWLRNLIAAGHIAPGEVDDRSIKEVTPNDLRGFMQCHFFAGIAGWSYALRLAGWPDDRPVWTGSCPCQPFSQAGAQRGFEDERHLWPDFFRLIRERRPGIVFGEQVAGAAGYAWWDHVAADLEGAGYAAAAANLGAHSVGAPHIRQRLYWVADSLSAGRPERWAGTGDGQASGGGGTGDVAHADGGDACTEREQCGREQRQQQKDGGTGGRMGTPHGAGLERWRDKSGKCAGERSAGQASPWDNPEWLACSDGKARPTQPGLFPLAHGVSGRVGRLRAYGNAIVPQVGAAFVRACLD